VATVSSTVSVGNGSTKRRIMNVAPGVAANDAVTVAQLQAAVAGAAEPATPSRITNNSHVIEELRPEKHDDSDHRAIVEMRRELQNLRALVQQQQQEITSLRESKSAAAGAPR
jgi:autotransporter adhesin